MVLRRFRLLRRAFASTPSASSRGMPRGRDRCSRSLVTRGEEVSASRVVDEETRAGPKRRFAAEAEHGMFNWFDNDYSPQAEVPDSQLEFHEFYGQQVRQLQEKQGNKYHFPISGNLYMYRFLAPFGDDSGLFQKKTNFFVDTGLTCIIIVQIFGPVILLVTALNSIRFGTAGSESIFGLNAFQYQFGSDERGLSFVGQRFLGFFFLILFIMSGQYALKSDRQETKKLFEMSVLFQQHADEKGYRTPSEFWLWMGAFVNSFCLMTICVAMCFAFIVSEGPKDVLFDSFGLTFLYNLDDIGGDLAFLDEKWDEDIMGDIYGELADSPSGILADIKGRRKETFTPDNVYKIAEWVMWLLLLVLPLIFLFLDMAPKEENRRLRDMASIEETPLSDITAGELVRLVSSLGLNSSFISRMGV